MAVGEIIKFKNYFDGSYLTGKIRVEDKDTDGTELASVITKNASGKPTFVAVFKNQEGEWELSDGEFSTLTEAKIKELPKYTIMRHRRGNKSPITGTLPELLKYFSYTLEKGNSWDKKVNRNPKNINSLIQNLDRAEDAATGNGYSGIYYTLAKPEEIQQQVTESKNIKKVLRLLETMVMKEWGFGNYGSVPKSKDWKAGKEAYYAKQKYDESMPEDWKDGYRKAQRNDLDTQESDNGYIAQQKGK